MALKTLRGHVGSYRFVALTFVGRVTSLFRANFLHHGFLVKHLIAAFEVELLAQDGAYVHAETNLILATSRTTLMIPGEQGKVNL